MKQSTQNHIVIIVDLCSSSQILEALQEAGQLKRWKKMWKKIFSYMIMRKSFYCTPNKFLGDGFLILYKLQTQKHLLKFLNDFNEYALSLLIPILIENNIKPKRIGFTYGVAKGKTVYIRLNGSKEYMGEVINISARLQGLLKAPDETNTVLITKQFFEELPESDAKKLKVSYENHTLRNLFDDKEVECIKIKLENEGKKSLRNL